MSFWTSVYLGSGNFAPSTTGAELSGSRRRVDLSDVQYARLSYSGGGLLGDCAFGSSYSLDNGATWAALLPVGPSLAASNYIYTGPWVDVKATTGPLSEVWINAVGYGASLLGGLTYTVAFVELQLR